ncbi:MAG: beta-ketoacyl-[acyl-carrier-protein] synthase family protein [Acidobacteria bacterium]|nr:MAG: beta-ketoacyl-[acyl-carrier-protein] synthase family protein [Acidobacteriota bacterium]
MTAHRVVVTGIGVVTANAANASEYAGALRAGRSGIRDLTLFDPGFPFRQAGQVDLPEDGPEGKRHDRVSRLALTAGEQAVADAGLERGGPALAAAGLCVGTSRGPAQSLELLLGPAEGEAARGLMREVPFYSIARNLARHLGLSGPSSTVTMACVSSSLAIGRAMDTIRRGRARVMLAGGADSLTNLSFSGFSVLRAMTRTTCRPFDRNRDGMVLGEGAGLLILEELDHARARGARCYGELLGWGTAGDAHHATSPHPEGRGLAAALASALRDARTAPEEIDHANLHGTGTPANDPAECQAVRSVFGAHCEKLPVNSLKPMIGHTLGAAGALELAGSLLAMLGGFIPPTLNSRETDPRCDLDVVTGAARETAVRTLVSTKSAFGGANVAIVARAV